MVKILYNSLHKSTSLKPNSNNSKNLNIYVKLNTWSTCGISRSRKQQKYHNKPDIIIWNHKKIVCTVMKVAEKKNNYEPLILNMHVMYPNYKFEMKPAIIGCLGYVQNDLN